MTWSDRLHCRRRPVANHLGARIGPVADEARRRSLLPFPHPALVSGIASGTLTTPTHPLAAQHEREHHRWLPTRDNDELYVLEVSGLTLPLMPIPNTRVMRIEQE